AGHLLLCRCEIHDLAGAIDAESRLQLLGEPFMLIVADDDDDIGLGTGEDVAQRIELLLATIVIRLARRRRVARGEILGLAQDVELIERIIAAAKGEGLVAAIGGGAAVPFLRRRRQHRAVRCPDSENQLGHETPPARQLKAPAAAALIDNGEFSITKAYTCLRRRAAGRVRACGETVGTARSPAAVALISWMKSCAVAVSSAPSRQRMPTG